MGNYLRSEAQSDLASGLPSVSEIRSIVDEALLEIDSIDIAQYQSLLFGSATHALVDYTYDRARRYDFHDR